MHTLNRWGGILNHLLIDNSLSNICTKNYWKWNRTTIVEIIIAGWVLSFLWDIVYASSQFKVKCSKNVHMKSILYTILISKWPFTQGADWCRAVKRCRCISVNSEFTLCVRKCCWTHMDLHILWRTSSLISMSAITTDACPRGYMHVSARMHSANGSWGAQVLHMLKRDHTVLPAIHSS